MSWWQIPIVVLVVGGTIVWLLAHVLAISTGALELLGDTRLGSRVERRLANRAARRRFGVDDVETLRDERDRLAADLADLHERVEQTIAWTAKRAEDLCRQAGSSGSSGLAEGYEEAVSNFRHRLGETASAEQRAESVK